MIRVIAEYNAVAPGYVYIKIKIVGKGKSCLR